MTNNADLDRAKAALDALKIQNAVTSLASRFDTRLVMRVLRDWLDFMDRQVAQIDGRDDG